MSEAQSLTNPELLELLDAERRVLKDLHSVHAPPPVRRPWVGEGDSFVEYSGSLSPGLPVA